MLGANSWYVRIAAYGASFPIYVDMSEKSGLLLVLGYGASAVPTAPGVIRIPRVCRGVGCLAGRMAYGSFRLLWSSSLRDYGLRMCALEDLL